MKLVYFGSGEFGVPTLAALHQRHELLTIVTQPDRPAGRSRQPTPTPVGQWAAEHAANIPLLKPERVNEESCVARLRELPAQAFVVIAFGQKLGTAVLAGRFAINLHASLLPRWRGAAPIHHAVLAGDARTGNSVITLAQEMDAGVVLGESVRPIDPLVTTGELHDLLASDGPALVENVLAGHLAGTLNPRLQEATLVTRATKLSKADGWIDWSRGADECRRRVHGLTPWPGVSVKLLDESVKLLRCRVAEAPIFDAAPGTLADVPAGLVACGGGTALQLLEVQPASGRAMGWTDFARGRSLRRGVELEGSAPC